MSPHAAAVTRDKLFEAYALADRSTPLVRMNFIMSLDGAVTVEGRSGGLGDASDRLAMQVLRTLADVVLVGAGTVRAEGYGGVRVGDADGAWRRSRGLASQPRIAVVSSRLDFDPGHPFFAQATGRPIVVTHAGSPAHRREALAEVADVLVCGEASVDPALMVQSLVELGLPQVLCEGGPHLFGSLVEADHVDELCLSLSPLIVAGDPQRMVRGVRELCRRLRLVHAITAGDLLLLRYARAE